MIRKACNVLHGGYRWLNRNTLRLVRIWVIAFTAFVIYMWLEVRDNQSDLRKFAQVNRELGLKGDQAHQANCAVKADLERRVNSAKDFLKENPNGIPGLSRASIEVGINNTQDTVDALEEVLDC